MCWAFNAACAALPWLRSWPVRTPALVSMRAGPPIPPLTAAEIWYHRHNVGAHFNLTADAPALGW